MISILLVLIVGGVVVYLVLMVAAVVIGVFVGAPVGLVKRQQLRKSRAAAGLPKGFTQEEKATRRSAFKEMRANRAAEVAAARHEISIQRAAKRRIF